MRGISQRHIPWHKNQVEGMKLFFFLQLKQNFFQSGRSPVLGAGPCFSPPSCQEPPGTAELFPGLVCLLTSRRWRLTGDDPNTKQLTDKWAQLPPEPGTDTRAHRRTGLKELRDNILIMNNPRAIVKSGKHCSFPNQIHT